MTGRFTSVLVCDEYLKMDAEFSACSSARAGVHVLSRDLIRLSIQAEAFCALDSVLVSL